MCPSETILELGGRSSFLVVWPQAHAFVLSCGKVVFQEDAVVAAAVSDIRIAWLRHRVRAFAIRYAMPIRGRNRSAARRAGTLEGAFVLLRAVNMKRELIVEVDMVELARRLI